MWIRADVAGVDKRQVILLIGERIRKLRKQRGFSQEQLGELVHFSQSKISKIECDERGDWDSLSDLRLIARALKVPIEELVREEAENEEPE